MAKWLHRLTNIDPVAKTATCSHCGLVSLGTNGVSPYGTVKWRCLKARAAWKRDQFPYRNFKGTECEICGFVPLVPWQLDVDHLDGDHTNDDPSNLATMCACCHRLKTWIERQP